ncbi:hypothetical protein M0R79_03425 [Ignavigranum ruoffiae]|uniref:hypothetical protein n=1 Tax=Ignavigranum ruoffiae TaxID=89093 RepID=UPI00204C5F8D|nr:hypothetical protein [Ignavigranum ruoffiae]UPQ86436.1 hypothetical protein M0R79_03425 [Ignavigranum ruoffiae]
MNITEIKYNYDDDQLISILVGFSYVSSGLNEAFSGNVLLLKNEYNLDSLSHDEIVTHAKERLKSLI